MEEDDLRKADFRGADLQEANFRRSDLREATLDSTNLSGVTFDGSDLRGVNFGNSDLSGVKSFYQAVLDPEILAEIREKWPEKLATVWDFTKFHFVIDDNILVQIRKPDWHGWTNGKEQQGK